MTKYISNKKVILLAGKSTTGKTSTLMNMQHQNKAIYFNCDLKEIPFPHSFKHEVHITDPLQIVSAIHAANALEDIDTIIIDTISQLLNNFERMYIQGSSDSRAQWGNYSKLYGDVIHALKAGNKNVLVLAHTRDQINEKDMVLETAVQVKGAVAKMSVEADFTNIITNKRVSLATLEGISNPFLTITEDDKENGFKYVIQTRIDADTIGEKTRSPIGMWAKNEKYIDNNLDYVIQKIEGYYND